MAACHGSTQMSMRNPLHPPNWTPAPAAPLRRIVSDFVDDLDIDHDVLECGHIVRSPTDRNGVATSAVRRRCAQCVPAPSTKEHEG